MYIDGFLIPVPSENKDSYLQLAKKTAEIFKKLGATRVVECWQDDISTGEVTDFYSAVKAKNNEAVIFSWIEYPSKEIRDAAVKSMMEDPIMMDLMKDMPFDGKRMIMGGFKTLIDH